MSEPPRILAFAGSTRSGSFNKKLIRRAAEAAREAGGDVTLIDLRDFPMPLYDGDLEAEQGLPARAQAFKDLLKAHRGVLIASPEYNSGFSGVLKNAIDWASRPQPEEPPLAAFDGKVCGLMSASPGGLGGLRGLALLRQVLSNIRVLVIPDQIAVARAAQAFAEDGSLADEGQAEAVRRIARKVVGLASAWPM